MYLKRTKNWSATFFLFLLTILLFTACPEDPKPKPVKADCPPGYLPCEDDSTICCEVICPPGYILGGEDSTECIPVECPEYYYLCGEDSIDCCLEISSHDVTWEIDTILYSATEYVYNFVEQVAIINDSLIWAVGEFRIPDSTGAMTDFERSFNLAEWNGKKWELKKILSSDGTQAPSLFSIYTLNENNIWIGSSIPRHWDGSNWNVYNSTNGWISFNADIKAIWGSGSDDVFFVSTEGQVNHWDGSRFERMETPTEVVLVDVWGSSPDDVWSVGWSETSGSVTLIHYDGIEWSLKHSGDVNDWKPDSLSGTLISVQTFPDDSVRILGEYGIYSTTASWAPEARLREFDVHLGGFPLKMRGIHGNDLFICGQRGVLTHYNGESYNLYSVPDDYYFEDLDVSISQIVAVARISNGVVAVRGVR